MSEKGGFRLFQASFIQICAHGDYCFLVVCLKDREIIH